MLAGTQVVAPAVPRAGQTAVPRRDRHRWGCRRAGTRSRRRPTLPSTRKTAIARSPTQTGQPRSAGISPALADHLPGHSGRQRYRAAPTRSRPPGGARRTPSRLWRPIAWRSVGADLAISGTLPGTCRLTRLSGPEAPGAPPRCTRPRCRGAHGYAGHSPGRVA